MRSCYIKEVEGVSFFKKFLFAYFKTERLAKKQITREQSITIIHIPRINHNHPGFSRKYYAKWCYILKMMGIKSFCAGNIQNELLKYYLRDAFQEIQGESVLKENFELILSFFAKKKGFSLSECELVLVSEQPQFCKEFFEKIIKKVRKVSVYTNKKELFNELSEELRTKYGVFLSVKGKEHKPKYFKRLYVNLEDNYLFPKNFFQQIPILDIYQKYQNSYNDILLDYKTEVEKVINEHKIDKNLPFIAYLEGINGNISKKDYKIINIRKL